MKSQDQNDLIRERDFYRAKNLEFSARIKSLEFDNAELVRKGQENLKRINELTNKGAYRPRPRKGH